jgi:hypothetical protein
MTLTQFLDVAYALLVEEYRRLGANLTEALDRTREYAQGGHKHPPLTVSGNTKEAVTAVPQHSLTAEELANERALAALEQMMSGVGAVG